MKKIFTTAILIVASLAVAKAQTGNPQKLFALDSIKVIPDYTAPFKKLPPMGQLKLQQYKLQEPLNGLHIPDNSLSPLSPLSTFDNMPVAKLSSADKMPVLKLGDTETTHFTMLVKPIAAVSDTKKVVVP